MAKLYNRSRTVAIEVCLPFNFAVVFDFNLFPVPPSKEKFIGDILINSQNTAVRIATFPTSLLPYYRLPLKSVI